MPRTFAGKFAGKFVIPALLAQLLSAAAFAEGTPALRETVTPVFQEAIPNLPGKQLVSVVVDYPPGASTPAHHHARSAFIYGYVLSGEIRSQVGDGPARIFKAGETFSEAPGAAHRVSANASATAPARLLATFVVDTSDKALTTLDHQGRLRRPQGLSQGPAGRPR